MRMRIALVALAALALVLSPGCGEPDVAPASGLRDVPLPLAGERPAQVVGAAPFARFSLLTTGEGFPRSASEDEAGGIAAAAVAAVNAAEAEASADLGARRIRSASAAFLRAAAVARTAAWPRREEGCLLRALRCFELVYEPVEMLHVVSAIMALREARADGLAVARSRADLGALYGSLANYDRALDHLDAAASAFARYGMVRLQAHALVAMGLVGLRRADYGPAVEHLEHARTLLAASSDARRKAQATNVLATVYAHLGDSDRARALYDEALGQLGSESSVERAEVLGNLAGLHFHLGADEEALERFEQALAMFETHEDARGTAGALFGLGRVRKLQGGYHTALEMYERALALQADDTAAAARTRCAIAETNLALGHADEALLGVEAALDAARGAMPVERVELMVVASLARLERGEHGAAVEGIRAALDLLAEVSAGLADEHVVGLREHRGWIFDAGIAVALRTGRVDLAAEFLEHGRAGALLEAMGARGALRGVAPELREVQTLAAHRVAQAHRAYQEARAARQIQDLRAAVSELDAARAAHRLSMQNLQRAAKRAASVFHPVPDSLEAIRGALRAGEALILYALLPLQAYALVVSPGTEARIVWLGNTADLRTACEGLRVDAPVDDPQSVSVMDRLDALRVRVVDALKLPADTRRLLLCPDGSLCYVPFPLLLRDATFDVACLPSGTTLRLLAQERARTGVGVLALGDPDYRIEHQGRSLQVYAEGVPLEPLPATRAEVMAITTTRDLRLLGAYATVGGLAEAARTRPRWSVIHLACHGLIDPRTPTLSSLALTPDAGDDGFLTALEVYGMSLPADLVVLSGCNTGRGRFLRGEGLVGLMRAFMCAGAPRVLVSLWKVDDEATRALMVAFHRAWQGGGVSPAEALRRAQAEVRAQPRWAHPRYWGAWVLWGLAD